MSSDDGSLNFLVVDDNEDIRDVLVRMVERLGHRATTASDGLEAVEILAERRFDFMLLDLTMPRMTGDEVVRWLKAHPDREEGLRVVVISAWVGQHRAQLEELGVHAVMSKPFRLQELRELISGTLSAPTSWSSR